MNWMEPNLQTSVPSGTDNVWPSSYGRLQPVNGRVVMHIFTKGNNNIHYNCIKNSQNIKVTTVSLKVPSDGYV